MNNTITIDINVFMELSRKAVTFDAITHHVKDQIRKNDLDYQGKPHISSELVMCLLGIDQSPANEEKGE